ncbi:oncoprotein-induced transcript 3 protein-like [Lingula anatina]|uniref:Oncoprotein-induced transcript 3 protein-like n=1 Tax=Lingula anatina TaxID=7574 RepID=A0A1S3KBJ3_LINAN|nr:oncoprotein-induced transcript 3 protein-like [Lingula anatina]|eukprot:XP_013419862.1 oncoprotein-induced transcript 3 protein-like [Lingula anatina]
MSIFGSRGCGVKKMNDFSRFTERPHSPFYQCWRKEMIWSIFCCTFCLLLHGSLSESSTANDGAKSRHAVDPCIKHGILAQGWRNVNNARDVDKRGNTHCDKGNDFPGWYRFRGGAGNKMLDKCPTSRKRCGTHAPMWLTESHPTVQAGVTSIKACAYWISNCTWSDTVKVKLCLAGFYVYYLPKVPECSLAYCGESHDLCLDNNGGCERKCSMVNDTAVCSCPKGFRLASNKKTCGELELNFDVAYVAIQDRRL